MTWEETIEFIRKQPSFNELVEKAYLDENLPINVERFIKSNEFEETLKRIRTLAPKAKTLLDIGSGNGISALAFALNGFTVTAVEPDPSYTIGAGAIRKLKDHYQLGNLTVVESYAEDLTLTNKKYDVIYARQCLHHAYDLPKFLHVVGLLANTGGVFISTRDHVIYNDQDKAWFLANHPLQKYYGGENAFTLDEYRDAIYAGGFNIVTQLGHYDSVINYFPMPKEDLETYAALKQAEFNKSFRQKYGFIASLPLAASLYMSFRGIIKRNFPDEAKVPGRLYTFIAIKS